MATFTSYANGQFCWVDLMSREIASAKTFYTALLGCETDDQDTQGGPPYAIFKQDGQQIAGLGQMNDEMKASGMPPIWNSYISVDDLAATVDKAGQLGAKVTMPPMQVVDAGHMGILEDPTGAYISLWQKINHCGAELANVPGTWVWNELHTRDPDSAIKFYGDVFGWSFEKEPDSPSNYWIHKNGDRMNGGIMETTPDMGDVPPCWAVYFAVDDINASSEKVKELGGQLLNGPFEVSVGHISVVSDSDGGVFQLIQLTVPPDE